MPKKQGRTAPGSNTVQLTYQLLRNTTSPDEASSNVKSFVVNLPAFEILKLDTRENLRSYIAEYNPRKRNRVHEAIAETIEFQPNRFITRNSGFVIAASDIVIDDKNNKLELTEASILNGAQSQGEIKRWKSQTNDGDPNSTDEESPFFVRAEIIVDADSKQIVETAIARNTATPVKSISQAGARGVLDDLEKRILDHDPKRKIRKKETDEGEGWLDTRKVLQYARLLMPESISKNQSSAEKLRAYKNPEQCLTDFAEWYETQKSDPEAKARYEFTVGIAPLAVEEYEYWESHNDWNGKNIWGATKKGGRACKRDPNTNKITWVSPGLVFPILGAMSAFVVEDGPGKWKISKPGLFKPDEMIDRAIDQFRSVNSDPMQMGRNAGAYDALKIYPDTIVQVMHDMSAADKN